MPAHNFGSMKITVKDAGTGQPPWGRDVVHKYHVTVAHRGARYSADAYGSIADHESGKRRPAEMAAMVLDELLSAAADPDEFVAMVVGEESGLAAVKKGKTAEKVIKAARRFGYADLEAAVSEARERGLL